MKAIQEKFQGEGQIDLARKMLEGSSGIERADTLSIRHIETALECLSGVRHEGRQVLHPDISCPYHKALVQLAIKVKTRTK